MIRHQPGVGPGGAGPAARSSPLTRDTDIAATISKVVSAVPGVAALSGGEHGQIGTFAPGRSVPGVRIDDQQVQVHIVARYGTPIPGTAAGIGAALAPLLAGRGLHVAVQDILLPGEQPTEPLLVAPSADPTPAAAPPCAQGHPGACEGRAQ